MQPTNAPYQYLKFEEQDLDTYKMRLDTIMKQIGEVFRVTCTFPYQIVTAGGVWRGIFDLNDYIQDVDLFPVGATMPADIVEMFIKHARKCGWYLIFKCPENTMATFKTAEGLKVQLIYNQPYSSIEDLLSTFDIRACKLAYNYGHNQLVYASNAASDIKLKEIVLDNITYPVATLSRIEKYKRKGYTISDKEMRKYFLSVFDSMNDWIINNTERDINDWFDNEGRKYID